MADATVAVVEAALTPPTELGRLFPTYYRDVDLIFLKGRVERPMAHTINLVSHVFLGTDEDGVLGRVGILASRGYWTVDATLRSWTDVYPHALTPRSGNVTLAPSAIAHGSYGEDELSLRVITDPERRSALITFDRPGEQVQPVALSARVFAFLSDSRLIGFFTPLTPPQRPPRSAGGQTVEFPLPGTMAVLL